VDGPPASSRPHHDRYGRPSLGLRGTSDGGEPNFVGNWFLELTPQEADALAERLVEIVQELRARPEPTRGADRALVSISVLPWL
jgi:hypothetical protein